MDQDKRALVVHLPAEITAMLENAHLVAMNGHEARDPRNLALLAVQLQFELQNLDNLAAAVIALTVPHLSQRQISITRKGSPQTKTGLVPRRER